MSEWLKPGSVEEACNLAQELGDVGFIYGDNIQEVSGHTYWIALGMLFGMQDVELQTGIGMRIGASAGIRKILDAANEEWKEKLSWLLETGVGTLGEAIQKMSGECCEKLGKRGTKIRIVGADHAYRAEILEMLEHQWKLEAEEVVTEIFIPE